MPSTTAQVQQHLEGDYVIRDALSRGVLNYRRASRWLIDHNGWETTEEAVVSALRRYTPTGSKVTVEEGYAALAGARVGIETGLALVTTPRLDVIQERVHQACRKAGPEMPAGEFRGSRTVTYLVEKEAVKVLRSHCRTDDIENIVLPVSQLFVSLETECTATGMALTILLQTFSHRGIRCLHVFNSMDEFSFLLRDEGAHEAYEGLLHLCRPR